MSNEIYRMLERPDKAAEEAIGILPRLYRSILGDLGITSSKFNQLMEKYLNDRRNGFSHDPKRKSSERSNLMKEILRKTMTFKVFLKGIKLISPLEARVEIHLKWTEERTTVHSYNLGRVSETTLFDLLLNEGDEEGVVEPTPTPFANTQVMKVANKASSYRPALFQIQSNDDDDFEDDDEGNDHDSDY